MIELHLADDITQGGCGQVFDGGNRALHAVGVKLCICDLEEDNGINLHRDVILCDNRLRREIRHLFLQGDDLCNALQKRNLYVQAGFPRGMIGTEPFNDIRF